MQLKSAKSLALKHTWRERFDYLEPIGPVNPNIRLKINNIVGSARQDVASGFRLYRSKTRQRPGKYSYPVRNSIFRITELQALGLGTGEVAGFFKTSVSVIAKFASENMRRFDLDARIPDWKILKRAVRQELKNLHDAGLIIYQPGYAKDYSLIAIPALFKANPDARLGLARTICESRAHQILLESLDAPLAFKIQMASKRPAGEQRREESRRRVIVHKVFSQSLELAETQFKKAKRDFDQSDQMMAKIASWPLEVQQSYLEAKGLKTSFTPHKVSLSIPELKFRDVNYVSLTRAQNQLSKVKKELEGNLRRVSEPFRQAKPIYQQVADVLTAKDLSPLPEWTYRIREPGKRKHPPLRVCRKKEPKEKRQLVHHHAKLEELSSCLLTLDKLESQKKIQDAIRTEQIAKRLSPEIMGQISAVRSQNAPKQTRLRADQEFFESKETGEWLSLILGS